MAHNIKYRYVTDDSTIFAAKKETNQDTAMVRVLVYEDTVDSSNVSYVDLALSGLGSGVYVNEDQDFERDGKVISNEVVKDLAKQGAKIVGIDYGFEINGKNYKEGDIYPKGADPNQVGNDPTSSNAPTEAGETQSISPIEAEPLPVTQPTLAPLPQGKGLLDTTPSETATSDNSRPEDPVTDTNAYYYTSSPLGLLNSAKYDYSVASEGGRQPLFSSRNFLIDQSKKSADGTPTQNSSPLSDNPLDFSKKSGDIHNSIIYDVSTNNIIKKLEEYPSLKLRWADFAYCRDFGVYPNNRLVVCRRFETPVTDDLTLVSKNSMEPVSTLISWVDDQTNLLEFNFGEEWVDAGVSFVELLNEVGEDFGMKFMKLGDAVAGGFGFMPMPGATEGLQRQILNKLGIIDEKSESIIPSGTPNLVKEARQRKLLKDDTPGAGLSGKFSVKVKCAWEQKFISGVDPTLIYYDILQTVLSFGGSQAVFYLGKKSSLTGLSKFLSDYSKPTGALDVIEKVVQGFIDAVNAVKDKIISETKKLFDGENPPKDKEVDPNDANAVKAQEDAAKEADAKAEKDRKDALAAATGVVDKIIGGILDTIKKKYRVRVLGIVSALTGVPSTPWHVTIGNPLRPILSSGDMECSSVSVNLGPQLSFNDLPSYIEVEFTLTSARNLGIDEIMEKLNCGSIRIQEEVPNFWNMIEQAGKPTPSAISTTGPAGATASPTPDLGNNEGPVGPLSLETLDALEKVEGQGVLTPEAALELAGQSKVGNEITANGQTINPDPNSAEALLGKTESLPGSEYTVKSGDSISKIAKNKLGPNASKSEILAETKRIIALNKNKNPDEVDGIVNTNSQSDPDFIKPGDKLFI